MNSSWFSAGGILVLLIGVANGAALQKRWIPERMSDNDYGYDNQQHQTTSDDLTAYQPNYMNYWTDYFPGGYSGGGGDYTGMMYRAGGQAPPPGQVMMDPVQQLQYVQAYSYAQQLQQQYPNGVPLPYRPQPSPYQPYQPYQPGADPTGRSLLSVLALNQLNRQQMLSPNPNQHTVVMQAPQKFSSALHQNQFVLAEPQEEVFQVVEVQDVDPQSVSTLEEVSVIQNGGNLLDISALDSETKQHQGILEERILERLQEMETNENSQIVEVSDADMTKEENMAAEVVALEEVVSAMKSQSHNTENLNALEEKQILKEIKVLEKALAADANTKDHAKTHPAHNQENKKTPNFKFLAGRAGPGGSGGYVDPNMYANYGGDSGLVDMASPLDLVYPGAMVPSYSPVTPTYYPYAPPNPYSIPQQVYQPSGYGQATSGPYGAPVLPYSAYPTMPSYYNTQPPLRFARNSATAFPVPYAVNYVYGAVPMQLPQSG